MKCAYVLFPALVIFVLTASGCIGGIGGIRLVSENKSLTESDFGERQQLLQMKAEAAGLSGTIFRLKQDQSGYYIEASGISKEETKMLLAPPGTFKAVLTKPVYLVDGKGFLKLGQKEFEIENGKIDIDGKITDIDEFSIDDIYFKKVNESADKIVFYADLLTADDVKVFTDPQHSGILKNDNGYEFYVSIEMSDEAAQKLVNLISGSKTVAKDIYFFHLDSSFIVILDDEVISSFWLQPSMSGKDWKMLKGTQLTGTRETYKEVYDEKYRLQIAMIQTGKSLDLKIAEEQK